MATKNTILKISIAISLPVWIFMFWVVGSSYYRMHFQVGFFRPDVWKFNPDQYDWQMVINDTLNHLSRQARHRRDKTHPLPVLNLTVSYGDYQKLTRSDPGLRSQYIRTNIQFGEKSFTARIRNRGGTFWHYQFAKKSWRVKLTDGLRINGLAEFDLVAPKVYPFWEPIVDKWARKAGLVTFSPKLIFLYINNKYNGIVYLSEVLSSDFLRRNNLESGVVYGIDPEISEYIRHRQGISAAWADANKWLLLFDEDTDVERASLKKLINGLALPQREFDEWYFKSGALSSIASQLAFNSYIGIFHQNAVANIKIHWSERTKMFSPILWDFLFPARSDHFLFAGNPIFNKLIKSPLFLDQVTTKMADLVRLGLNSDFLKEDAIKGFDQVRTAAYYDGNLFSVLRLETYYDLNLYFVAHGLSLATMKYYEEKVIDDVLWNSTKAEDILNQLSVEYSVWGEGGNKGMSISCLSWRPCYVHKIKVNGKAYSGNIIPDLNCNRRRDRNEAKVDLSATPIKIFPVVKEVRTTDDQRLNPTFPAREDIDYQLGTISYPYFADLGSNQKIELLVSNSIEGNPRWIQPVFRNRLENDHDSYHTWGVSCD